MSKSGSSIIHMMLIAMVIATCALCTLGDPVEKSMEAHSLKNISNSSTSTAPHSPHDHHYHVHLHMAFPLVIIGMSALCKQIKSVFGMPIPHTVLMFFIGFFIGLLTLFTKEYAVPDTVYYQWCKSVISVKEIDPHFLLQLFLPILLFESAFSTDWHVFRRVIVPVAALAIPGLLLATFLTAVYLLYLRIDTQSSRTSWEDSQDDAWYRAIVFGAILSATDPVAVVAILKTLGAKEHLSITIEGESLLNDGIAVVLFYAFKVPATKENNHPQAKDVVKLFFRMAFGGIAWGIAMGFASSFLIGLAHERPVAEITTTICVAYLTFILGERWELSGVLAIVALGLFYSAHGHVAFTPSVMHDLHRVWELLGFLGNSLMFSFSGVIIAYVFDTTTTLYEYGINLASPSLYLNFFLLYVALTIIRGVVLLLLYPVLHYCAPKGYQLSWKDCVVSVWGALRGAVGLALAMFIALESKNPLLSAVDECSLTVAAMDVPNGTTIHDLEDKCVRSNHTTDMWLYQFGSHMNFTVGLLVIFTLIINSMTMKPLLKCLKLTEISKQKQAIFNQAMEQLEEESIQEISLLKKDLCLQCVNWDEVRKGRYTSDYIKYRSRGSMKLNFSASFASNLVKRRRRSMHRGSGEHQEARRRFLLAVRASYMNQFRKRFIGGPALRILMEANDVALDKDCDVNVEWAFICKAVPFLRLNDIVLEISAQMVLSSKLHIVWTFLKRRQLASLVLLLYILTQENKCCNWLLTKFLHDWIRMACDISSAYLSAREDACEVLTNNLGSECALENFKTSAVHDMYRASRALVHCHRLFPAITTSVKTYRALLVVLNSQKLETKRLLTSGAIDYEEASTIMTLIDSYFHLKQNKYRFCPQLQIPSVGAVLREVPWMHDVDEASVNQVIHKSTSMTYKLDDLIIEHGHILDHIYVIGSGTVSLQMEATNHMEKFFIGTAGGYGQYKPEHVTGDKHEEEAMREQFPVHNPSDETVKRRQNSQVGNLLLGFYGSPESSIDFAAGQTIGALSWLVERTPCRYTVRATSTHVEIYKVPLDLIQANEALQQGLWQSAGRSLAFEIIRQMGAYLYWTEASLREHISHWDVIHAYHTEQEQPDWFQVDFEVPVVLIQGSAVCVRVQRSKRHYFESEDSSEALSITMLNAGGLPLQLTNQQMKMVVADQKFTPKASPTYLRPCPPDDASAVYVNFWYVSKKSRVCAPKEAKWTVDDMITKPKKRTRPLHQMVRTMLSGTQSTDKKTASKVVKMWLNSVKSKSDPVPKKTSSSVATRSPKIMPKVMARKLSGDFSAGSVYNDPD